MEERLLWLHTDDWGRFVVDRDRIACHRQSGAKVAPVVVDVVVVVLRIRIRGRVQIQIVKTGRFEIFFNLIQD